MDSWNLPKLRIRRATSAYSSAANSTVTTTYDTNSQPCLCTHSYVLLGVSKIDPQLTWSTSLAASTNERLITEVDQWTGPFCRGRGQFKPLNLRTASWRVGGDQWAGGLPDRLAQYDMQSYW